jgi:hypothetical protein
LARIVGQAADKVEATRYPTLIHRTETIMALVMERPKLPGAKPTWFFAPDQIRKRAKEWGPGGIDTRFSAARSTR